MTLPQEPNINGNWKEKINKQIKFSFSSSLSSISLLEIFLFFFFFKCMLIMLMTGPWNIFRMTPLISLSSWYWHLLSFLIQVEISPFFGKRSDFQLKSGHSGYYVMRLSLLKEFYLFSNFWLLWVFIAAQEFSLVAVSRGYFLGVEHRY